MAGSRLQLLSHGLLLLLLAASPIDAYATDTDGDGFEAGDDCDDNNPAVSPSAAEICDPADLDEDCDGLADDADPNLDLSTVLVWYADADGDGSAGTASFGCDLPDGASSTRDDCDDAAPDVFPGATEVVCDDVDDDCSGSDLVITVYADNDGDGHGDPLQASPCDLVDEGWVPLGDDCDDTNLDVFPGAPERGCDGLDADCDGLDGVRRLYQDADGDGHGDPAVSADCDTVGAGWVESGDDCDDTRAEISPSATEIPCGEDDENCDGDIDHSGEIEVFVDADGDTYGDATQSAIHCNDTPVAEGWAVLAGDCDDADPERYPDNYDDCDGFNNDCDTYYDEDASWEEYYLDQDGDGWGSGYATFRCSDDGPEDWVTLDGDCDDSDTWINPDAEEVCDNLDNDCEDGVDVNGCGYDVCDVGDDCGGSGGFCCSGGSMLLVGVLLRRRSRSTNT